MVCINKEDVEKYNKRILIVSENGYGKQSELEEYRITHRGGKGVKTINITPKTGDLIAIKAVNEDNDLMIINKSGITIRMDVAKISVTGRVTQGVKLISLREDDSIASVCAVPKNEAVEAAPEGPAGAPAEDGTIVENPNATPTTENNN